MTVKLHHERRIGFGGGQGLAHIERKPCDVVCGAVNTLMLLVKLEMDFAGNHRLELGLNGRPVYPIRHGRTGSHKIDPAHFGRWWDRVASEECKEGRPVDTETSPPVPRPRLFVIGKVRVELSQNLSHLPSLIHRYVVIGIAVQDVDADGSEIVRKGQGIAGCRGSLDELLDRRGTLGASGLPHKTTC